jgi:membrane protein YdbS with pleckstrin-like domain
MKRKTVMFFVILCFLILILALSYLVGIWEEGMKTGFAQVVFLVGVVVGMVGELMIIRIEKKTLE